MAAAVTAAPAAAEAAGDKCAITVEFGSHCCGIDRAVFADVSAFLEASPLVADRSEKAWGMEGEQTICVQTKSAADAASLYAQLKARLPARARAGYIKVSQAGGAKFQIDPGKF